MTEAIFQVNKLHCWSLGYPFKRVNDWSPFVFLATAVSQKMEDLWQIETFFVCSDPEVFVNESDRSVNVQSCTSNQNVTSGSSQRWNAEGKNEERNISRVETTTIKSKSKRLHFMVPLSFSHSQCFLFSRIIGRSPQKLFIFISKKILTGSKYPKNILFNFEKGSTGHSWRSFLQRN